MKGVKKNIDNLPPIVPATKPTVRRGYVQGYVRGFQSRSETHPQPFKKQPRTWTIWTFRVERLDEHGRRLELAPVELRGLRFDGVINEGDEVEVRRERLGDATLRPRSLRNVTTGASVVVKGESALDILLQVAGGILMCFLVFLCIAIALISLQIVGDTASTPDQNVGNRQQEQCLVQGDTSSQPQSCE